jgi:hypothetical protein
MYSGHRVLPSESGYLYATLKKKPTRVVQRCDNVQWLFHHLAKLKPLKIRPLEVVNCMIPDTIL